MAPSKKSKEQVLSVMPNHKIVVFHLKGISPLICHRMSGESRDRIIKSLFDKEPGKRARRGAEEKPDLEYLYLESRYTFGKGKIGISALSIRSALISAARNTDLTMNQMKQTVFSLADGVDRRCGTPVIEVVGTPVCLPRVVRTDQGKSVASICTMWETWSIKARVEYDADTISVKTLTELMHRAGLEVGLGVGRAEAKSGKGGMNGRFKISDK